MEKHDVSIEVLEALIASQDKITHDTPVAVMRYCRDMDGSLKAALIRRKTGAGYDWSVWHSNSPTTENEFENYNKAVRAFGAWCVHGTNGYGVK